MPSSLLAGHGLRDRNGPTRGGTVFNPVKAYLQELALPGSVRLLPWPKTDHPQPRLVHTLCGVGYVLHRSAA
jgi:hypothetical protein